MCAWTINYYYWVQTWGPIYQVAQANTGGATGEKALIFHSDGCVASAGANTTFSAEAKSHQIAGYILSDCVGQAGGAGDDSTYFLMIAP